MKPTSKKKLTNNPESKNFADRRRRHSTRVDSKAKRSDQEYKVGPGRPPREFQFKPGQSGNPTGAKRKDRSRVDDIKAMLERALSEKTKQGERDQLITKGAAGIAKLVDGFAAGDHRARRDLITLASRFGLDLTAGRTAEIERALGTPMPADDQAMVDDYVRRRFAELQYNDEVEREARNNPDVKPAKQKG